jgi:AAA15 family ATPase/GTPase
MNNRLKSVHIRRFKGITDAPFDTSPINVFIGANNSGKSTLAQVIHFSVGILQSVELAKGGETKIALVLA